MTPKIGKFKTVKTFFLSEEKAVFSLHTTNCGHLIVSSETLTNNIKLNKS
jgi:hypothetical protein